MGWIPAGTTFSYGQRSKCADLSELLRLVFKHTLKIYFAIDMLYYTTTFIFMQ